MAASSSAAAAYCGSWNHDVFLNFRGADTRKIFVGHLYKALDQKAINAFVDSEEDLRRDDNDPSEILQSIADSRLSVLVFSQNYAYSKWCLRELVKILDCMHSKKQIVVPIFYEVDPSDVCKLKGSFGEAFSKHELDSDMEEVQKWKSALTQAANLSGWDSRNYKDDAKLIEKIVEDISKKLIHSSSGKSNGLVGIDSHIAEMDLLLRLGVDDVRVVGIYGMPGIGKSTIARAIYDEIACQFEHFCFMENVKEGFKSSGAVHMQEKLLSRILEKKVHDIGILNTGFKMAMQRLDKKKVLLVLDDVENSAQIEALLGKRCSFGGGSRIIITTRDIQSLSGVNARYTPDFLSEDEALELFTQYAFRTHQATEQYYSLSRHAIEYAQGLPLALKVLGAYLDAKSVCEWEDELEKIKEIPHIGLQGVLRTSFDGLDPLQKDIFLDIACFFRGMDKGYVTKILESCGFYPHSGLRVLLDRALITISYDNRLEMHDLLQEIGWEIVLRQSVKDPGKRSRLWVYEDVDHVLTQNSATYTVEGISLDFSNSSKEIYITCEAFVRMKRLRVLRIIGDNHSGGGLCHQSDDCKQHLSGKLMFLSNELRLLLWHGSPLKSLPSNFNPENLVELDMRCSHIEYLWEGIKPLKYLTFVNLSNCQYLKKTPDFTEAMNLEELVLDGCLSLVEVHPSISALKNLVYMSLKGCIELKSLPSSIYMQSLKTFALSGCINLKKFPEISGIMEDLSELYLNETAIEELPSSVEQLQGLVLLNMKNCRSLACLPDNVCNLAHLTDLNLSGCSKLYHLPEKLGNLESLMSLEVERSGIKDLPFSILRLNKLKRLSCDGCKEMAAPLASWSSSIKGNCSYFGLQHLDLSDCNLLVLSDGIAHLSSLKTLELSRNNLEGLPAAMNQLRRLSHLILEACKRLKSIPELSSSIKYIDAHDCAALERVATPKPRYSTNLCFTFSNCLQLVQTKIFRGIVETHCHYQGNYLRPLSLSMSFPGSKIPDWFSHQCKGCSVTVQLPPNWFDDKFLGFAICGVSNFKGAHNDASDLSAVCHCTFKGNHGEYNFSFHLLDWGFKTHRFLQSDHMFVGYVPWSEYRFIEEGKSLSERYYREVTFEIVVENGVYTHDNVRTVIQRHCITNCGVRLYHVNHMEMQNLSIIQPITQSKSHDDSCEILLATARKRKREKEVEVVQLDESLVRDVVSEREGSQAREESSVRGRSSTGEGVLPTFSFVRTVESADNVYAVPTIHDNTKTRKGRNLQNSLTWTRVASELVDDGHSWRKYGEKVILGAKYPRNYYRCTHRNDQGCMATKQVQRTGEQPVLFTTTYRDNHTCRPVSTVQYETEYDETEESTWLLEFR